MPRKLKTAPKSKHIPVHLVADTYNLMAPYAELFGTPINHIAAEAIADWMATVGRARMEAIAGLNGKAMLGQVVEMQPKNRQAGLESATLLPPLPC